VESLEIKFHQIDSRLNATATKAYVDVFANRLSELEVATGNDPLQKVLRKEFIALRIHSARYGVGKEPEYSVDVAEVLRGYIKDDRIDILVTNETMKVHPFRDQAKKLFVEYSRNGRGRTTVVVDETHKLVIPSSPDQTDLMREIMKRT